MVRRRLLFFSVVAATLSVGWPLYAQQSAEETSPESAPDDPEQAESRPAGEDGGSSGGDDPAETSYALEGERLLVTSGTGRAERLQLPCEATSLLSDRQRLYLACGTHGVYVYSLERPNQPEGLGFRTFEGAVVDLFAAKGRIWVQIARTEARPLGEAAKPDQSEKPAREESEPPSEPPAEQPEKRSKETDRPAEREKRPVGTVLEDRSGTVVIDLGTSDGLRRGARVELFRRDAVDLGGEETVRESTIAVGEVVATSENRSEVQLGVGEQVAAGRSARPTDRSTTATALAPPRVPGLSSFEFTLRPFLALGTLGAGAVGQASYRYAFEWPGTAEVQFDPLSFGLASEANVYPVAGDVSLSYDTTVFRIGLGVGASSVADDVRDFEGDDVQSVAFALTQVARLGARDGLHLRVHNSFLLVGGEFGYGGTSGDIQVSLEQILHHTWFLIRGGGHVAGRAFGEIGLRVLALGNGGDGTLFLTPTIGGAGVWGERRIDCPTQIPNREVCSRTSSYAGPMVGFGMEWRF